MATVKKAKPKPRRREIGVEPVYGFGARRTDPLPIRITTWAGETVTPTVNIRGKQYHFYERIGLRATVKKRFLQLREQGYKAVNFQVKRGRFVVDNVIYTYPRHPQAKSVPRAR